MQPWRSRRDGPVPEERSTDTHDGRPLLDRDLEVVAHAHRQPRPERRVVASQRLREPSQGHEGRPCILRVAPRVGRRSSGPRRAARAAPAAAASCSPSVAGREAGLGRVGVDVDLEQTRGRSGPPRGATAAPRAPRESTDWMTSNSSMARPGLVALELARRGATRRPGAPPPWASPPGPGSRPASSGRRRPPRAAARGARSWRRRPAAIGIGVAPAPGGGGGDASEDTRTRRDRKSAMSAGDGSPAATSAGIGSGVSGPGCGAGRPGCPGPRSPARWTSAAWG